MVIVKYNGQSIAQGIGVVSQVGFNENPISVGERWYVERTYTISGTLKVCEEGATPDQSNFDSLIAAQQTLLTRLSQDYHALVIEEDGVVEHEEELCTIDDISFESSRYNRILPFTITIVAQPIEFFRESDKVIEPQDEWSFTEDRDGIVQVSHTISAQGLNTSTLPGNNNALENAKTFVQAKAGYDNERIVPFFICAPELARCTPDRTENVNRLAGTYSITETYSIDKLSGKQEILRYTIDIDKNQDSFVQITIQGEIRGCREQTLAQVRTRFDDIDFSSIVIDQYNKVDSTFDVNNIPISKSIGEDFHNKTISFNFTYDNNPFPATSIDYEVSLEENKGFVTASINGSIIGRGELNNRFQTVKQRFETLNIFNLAALEYERFFTDFPLNPNPNSKSISENSFNGTISFNAQYNNNDLPPEHLERFDYTLNFSPPTRQLEANFKVEGDGEYDIVDLGFENRPELEISGNAVVLEGSSVNQAIDSIKNELNYLMSTYAGATQTRLMEKRFNQSNNNKTISFGARWGFRATTQLTDPPNNYKQLTTLDIK